MTYQLEWGKSLASFHPKYSSAQQVAAITVHGWDSKTKKPISVRKTLDDIEDVNPDLKDVVRASKREEVITEPPARTTDEAAKTAAERLSNNFLRIVEATGATVGLPDLRSGRLVVIIGTGWPFDGRYRVLTSTHTINDSGYRTTFSARRIGPIKGKSGSGGAP